MYTWTLLLNGVSVSDTRIGHLIGYVSGNCPIQKIFVEFFTIIVRF